MGLETLEALKNTFQNTTKINMSIVEFLSLEGKKNIDRIELFFKILQRNKM